MRPSHIVMASKDAEINRLRQENAALRRRADVENPAQPVPEPAASAPSQSTADTRAADTTTEVTTPGSAMTDVAPDATTEVTTPGAALTDVAPDATTEVTSPVSGSETPSYDDMVTKIDPVAGTPADNSPAFSQDNSWVQSSLSQQITARNFATIRLARLRIQAGLAEGDDLVLAQQIMASKMSDEALRTEISTLASVAQRQAAQRPARRTTAARNVPSLVTAAAPSFGPTPSMGIDSDEIGFI